MRNEISRLLRERKGHFVFESGHHGETWLDLESLFLRPDRVEPLAKALADRIRGYGVEIVCGPLTEGAFLALMVAKALRISFGYATRDSSAGQVAYGIPQRLAPEFAGKKVAIIDDVINAGSAVGGTIDALRAVGAKSVVIGAIAVYGGSAGELAARNALALEALDERESRIWEPDNCPLCAQEIPLGAGTETE